VSERVFVVRTAIDMNVQRAAEAAMEEQLRQFGRDYHATQGALVVADLDGGVRAMVGGRDYGASQFNRAVDALRQPGSSFKPYVYASALMSGLKPTSIVVDGPICLGNWCPKNYSGGYSGSMTLTMALTRSINTIAVKLSVMIGAADKASGDWNKAKVGRAKIVALARKMGLRTPLPDTPSLPIGADEVTVLDHTIAYATFPNRGRAVAPHAALEVRNSVGDLIWRFDRDGRKPAQVIPPQVATDMVNMMTQVVEAGTARRAALDGIRAAGKTGTTNAYRDAWFVGYTGNFVCGVWYGNDDYSPTNRMTGGSLPAKTWHDVMAVAHQGVELKDIPGIAASPVRPAAPSVAAHAAAPRAADAAPAAPSALTRRGTEILVRIERQLDDAAKQLKQAEMPVSTGSVSMAPETVAVTATPSAPRTSRKN
jgi:penicillin-binding protein 1A